MGSVVPRCFSGTALPSGAAPDGGSLVVVVAPSCLGYDTAVQLSALLDLLDRDDEEREA